MSEFFDMFGKHHYNVLDYIILLIPIFIFKGHGDMDQRFVLGTIQFQDIFLF